MSPAEEHYSQIIEEILSELERHSSIRERRAVRRLSGLPTDAFPAVAAVLPTHPNSFVRAVVAAALPYFGPRARKPLLQALGDPAVPVRLSALLALNRIWNKKVAQRMIRLLDDPSPGIRHNAVVILARHGIKAAIPRLAQVLGDPSWHVRQQAARALGVLGAEHAQAALRRATSDGRKAVRDAARKALQRI